MTEQQLVAKRLASPWQPIDSKLELKILGKLGEEVSELATVVCRCIIQGVDEVQPVTGKSNRLWLEEEIADVLANISIAMARYHLDGDFITKRADAKIDYLTSWHEMA
jgi:NTP pyrophosphatase (non-canonical NTP hydrolase)